MFQILFLKSTVSGIVTPPRASRDIAFAMSSPALEAISPWVSFGSDWGFMLALSLANLGTAYELIVSAIESSIAVIDRLKMSFRVSAKAYEPVWSCPNIRKSARTVIAIILLYLLIISPVMNCRWLEGPKS